MKEKFSKKWYDVKNSTFVAFMSVLKKKARLIFNKNDVIRTAKECVRGDAQIQPAAEPGEYSRTTLCEWTKPPVADRAETGFLPGDTD